MRIDVSDVKEADCLHQTINVEERLQTARTGSNSRNTGNKRRGFSSKPSLGEKARGSLLSNTRPGGGFAAQFAISRWQCRSRWFAVWPLRTNPRQQGSERRAREQTRKQVSRAHRESFRVGLSAPVSACLYECAALSKGSSQTCSRGVNKNWRLLSFIFCKCE